MGKHNCNSACFVQTYRADTQTGTLGRRLYNHNVFWKQDSQVFLFFLHTGRATTSIIIDCQLSFGSNVLVFNENKYFCLKTFRAYFFFLIVWFSILKLNSKCRSCSWGVFSLVAENKFTSLFIIISHYFTVRVPNQLAFRLGELLRAENYNGEILVVTWRYVYPSYRPTIYITRRQCEMSPFCS